MFIAALFIIARKWKQPRRPLADKWIRKLWYIYAMECYSAIKKNAFESVLWSGCNWSRLYRVKYVRKKNLNILLTHIMLTHIYRI